MSNSVNFTMQTQQQDQWCWAATSTSTSLFYDSSSTWTQCTLVNAVLNQTTCCDDGSTSQCNIPWYLDQGLTQTGNLDHFSSGAEELTSVEQQVDNGCPLAVRIAWQGGGGHFVVISGYDDSQPGSETVTVNDPFNGTSVVTYSTFVTAYLGTGSWTHSYFTKQ